MLATVLSGAVLGIDGYVVRVEADVGRGLPSFSTVGLGDSAVREGRDRVASALRNSGFKFPMERIVVNLAPADVRKEGAAFDLPIALALLAATGQADGTALRQVAAVGELALDGTTRRVNGVLPVAVAAEREGLRGLMVPPENAAEASSLGSVRVLPVGSLASAARVLAGGSADEPPPAEPRPDDNGSVLSFSDVRGQAVVKRALLVSAAGGHNVLMVGPPGVGKTMLARRLPGIMPDLTDDEARVASMVHSVAGLLPDSGGLLRARPFRSPHHTVSVSGLIGGGRVPKPGEISLAHGGVLFLDELPEFRRDALEALRQPLEEGRVTITRAMSTVSYPAQFTLVASMNPCPCGNLGHPSKRCRCTPQAVKRYLSRVSGPLLDRIDIHVSVDPPSFEELSDDAGVRRRADARAETPGAGTMQDAAARVLAARVMQEERLQRAGVRVNALVPASALHSVVPLSGKAPTLARSAVRKLGLSARAYHKVLRVARTIADLAGSEGVLPEHLLEALQYRSERESRAG